jgi:hypothetical protein
LKFPETQPAGLKFPASGFGHITPGADKLDGWQEEIMISAMHWLTTFSPQPI